MPTQYETNFIIESGDNLRGVDLLSAATDAIERELQGSEGVVDYEIAGNQAGQIGFSHFSGERSHPSLPAAMRLEARLCTLDDAEDVAVQILTRFISADGTDLPERPAGPPRLLDAIVEQFPCRVGTSKITIRAFQVNDYNAERFAQEQMLSPARTLPVFLITPSQHGVPVCNPDTAQRVLQGVAQVAYCTGTADQALREHTGIATFGGAVRIYWPNCRPGRNGMKPDSRITDFYMPDAVSRLSLYEVQKACLRNEAGIDFDVLFSSARSAVVQERNRQTQATVETLEFGKPSADIITPAQQEREISGRRSEIEELEKARRLAEVRDLETKRQLQSALQTIERLTHEKESAEETIEDLEAEVEELSRDALSDIDHDRAERSRLRQQYHELRTRAEENEKTIVRLNDDNQRLRQRERLRHSADGTSIPLGSEAIGNITMLNHALNIYRDPCRKYIVRKLQANHGSDLTGALSKSLEFHDERQRRNAAEQPAAAFDVGDFSAIISANPNCFEDWQTLYRKTDDVRRIRNRAAHPPPDGLDKDWTLDSLRSIAEALESLVGKESAESAGEIHELIATIHAV